LCRVYGDGPVCKSGTGGFGAPGGLAGNDVYVLLFF
jgi:hypothetical protein